MITRYERALQEQLLNRYPNLETEELLEKLIALGVVDFSLCKILSVRAWVQRRVSEGGKKIDAMWEAADHFCCSYEYVRKCIYYYTDLNIE